jgi:Zn-dependent protease/CBS domain-containing protein
MVGGEGFPLGGIPDPVFPGQAMEQQSISLGKIFQIPVRLDYSWFLLFILLTWLLAGNYYPAEYPNWPVAEYWILGAITAVMLFASVLLHELGHSVLALRNGIPVHSITLFVFGGVAQISKEPTRPLTDFLVASAGLAVSFGLAVLFVLLQPVVAASAPLLALARYLAYINGMLLVFNLIPGFPLDGGRVFRSIVWGISGNFDRATLIAATLGRVIAFLFILLGVWLVFFGSFLNGLWIIFVGWFLESASTGEVRQQALRTLLAGRKVSQIMGRNYVSIPADISLQRLIDDHILGAGRRFFVVETAGVVAGVMTMHKLREIPRTEWPQTLVSRAMIPIEKTDWIGPDVELWDALRKMNEDGVNQLPVIADSRIQGVLSRENVVNFLQTLRELR